MSEEERYKKIGLDFEAVDRMLVEIFLQAHREAPEQIVLDLDSTDDYMANRKGGSFMVIMGTIVICPCTSSVGSTCCARGCG